MFYLSWQQLSPQSLAWYLTASDFRTSWQKVALDPIPCCLSCVGTFSHTDGALLSDQEMNVRLLIFNFHLEVPSAVLWVSHVSSRLLLPLLPWCAGAASWQVHDWCWDMGKEKVTLMTRGTWTCWRNRSTGATRNAARAYAQPCTGDGGAP